MRPSAGCEALPSRAGLAVAELEVCRELFGLAGAPALPYDRHLRYSFRQRQSLPDCRRNPLAQKCLRRFKAADWAGRYGRCRWIPMGSAMTAPPVEVR
jgi:hypothetical protein